LDTSLEAILERRDALVTPAVLATIVSTAGSTYRKAGARMLIESDGRITGLLSGGCFEHDLREHAGRVLESGAGRAIEYDTRGDDDWLFGLGAGCEGAMRILLEPLEPGSRLAASLQAAVESSRAGQVLALATVHAGSAAALGTRVWPMDTGQEIPGPLAEACERAVGQGRSCAFVWHESTALTEAWIDVFTPPPRILICGAGADVEPLMSALRALRFDVIIVDHRPAYAESARFPGALVMQGAAEALAQTVDLRGVLAAVVMSHHVVSDAAYLKVLASSDIEYVGILGPKARREKLLADLGALSAKLAPRVRGPVGLRIGAVTPEGIALAIAAELHEFAARHSARPVARSTPELPEVRGLRELPELTGESKQ
jgi:xanthine/CO dehydrogenase XdhC/CoxF family maturation factor